MYLRGTAGQVIYALDDAYRNDGSAEPGHPRRLGRDPPWAFSGSATSLVWPLMLAAVHIVALPLLAPFVLNVACSLAWLAVAARGLGRYVSQPGWRAVTLVLFVAATPLPILAFLGMEHALQGLAALALALAGVHVCTAPDAAIRRRRVAIAAAWAAMAVATRYDTASVVVGVAVITVATVGWRPAAVIGLAAAAPAAVYAAISTSHGWPAVPVAVLEKHRLAALDGTWTGVFHVARSVVHSLIDTPALVVLVLLALAQLRSHLRHRSRPWNEPLLLLVVFVIAAVLHLLLAQTGWGYRYEAYLIGLGLLANVAALASSGSLPARGWGRARWLAAALVVGALAHRATVAHVDLSGGGAALYENEYQQAAFLRDHPQPGAVMLADLGVSVFSDLPVVDTGARAPRCRSGFWRIQTGHQMP